MDVFLHFGPSNCHSIIFDKNLIMNKEQKRNSHLCQRRDMKDNRRDEKKKRRTEADLQRYSMLSKNGHTKGAPPFVAEILSPSTRSRDLLLKNYIYGNAGVREYWCIDPDQ